MSNGDVCQIKEFNSMIQQFITLHIPQDIPEGTKYVFKANGPTIDTKENKTENKKSEKDIDDKKVKGLDAVMVTAFN